MEIERIVPDKIERIKIGKIERIKIDTIISPKGEPLPTKKR